MTRTIIITGANGFIGSAMATYFTAHGNNVISLTRKNCDYRAETIEGLIQTHSPDTLIHAAGNASIQTSFDNPEQFNKDTIDLTRDILDGIAASKHAVRFVGLSSAAVYGSPTALPIGEGADLLPISPYGQAKLSCEKLIGSYAERLELQPVIVRIFSLFGSSQRRLVLFELFRQFQDTATDSVSLRGTGKETRDYLSIDVFVQKLSALLYSLAEKPKAQPEKSSALKINIASGDATEIGECAEIIRNLLESPKSIGFLGQSIQGQPEHWQADTALYDQIVRPKIPFNFEAELAKTLLAWKNAQKT